MNIKPDLSIKFTSVEAEELFKRAVVDYLRTHYKMSTKSSAVDVKFNTSMTNDYHDRGVGTPTFDGIEVTVKQPTIEPTNYWDR